MLCIPFCLRTIRYEASLDKNIANQIICEMRRKYSSFRNIEINFLSFTIITHSFPTTKKVSWKMLTMMLMLKQFYILNISYKIFFHLGRNFFFHFFQSQRDKWIKSFFLIIYKIIHPFYWLFHYHSYIVFINNNACGSMSKYK